MCVCVRDTPVRGSLPAFGFFQIFLPLLWPSLFLEENFCGVVLVGVVGAHEVLGSNSPGVTGVEGTPEQNNKSIA